MQNAGLVVQMHSEMPLQAAKIESTFATVRLRQRVSKGPGSRAAGIAMAIKLIESAQHRWRASTRATSSPSSVSQVSRAIRLLSTLWTPGERDFPTRSVGWIRSSEGYSVRLLGRTDLQYRDEWGSLAISAEAMSRPWVISAESMSHLWADIVVETATIPEDTRRPKSEVIDRLRRAFAYVGWNFIEGGRERRIGN